MGCVCAALLSPCQPAAGTHSLCSRMDGFKSDPAVGCMLGKEVGRGDSARASPKRKGNWSHWDSPKEGDTYLVRH